MSWHVSHTQITVDLLKFKVYKKTIAVVIVFATIFKLCIFLEIYAKLFQIRSFYN